ncbi:hypothetical protein BN1184_BA_00320 [Pantoea ananatis]|nr:hypothetical protein BN1184_BA_00320 [Pantoea ananatis]
MRERALQKPCRAMQASCRNGPKAPRILPQQCDDFIVAATDKRFIARCHTAR